MKILVLAAEESLGHPDGRRARRIASLLGDGDSHEVETVHVFGSHSRESDSNPSRALIRRTGAGDVPTRSHGLEAEVIESATSTSSVVMPGHHVLAEGELRLALRSANVDVVLLTQPTLVEFTRQNLASSVALAVVVDDPADPESDLALADALIVPGAESARAIADALGVVAPPIHVITPHSWRENHPEPRNAVVAGVGSESSRGVLESVVDMFVELFPAHPEWSLDLTTDSPGGLPLTTRAARAGVHGPVSSSTREVMENEVLPRAAAVVIATQDIGDAIATMLNGIASGAQIIIDTDDADVCSLIQQAPRTERMGGSAAQLLDILSAGPIRDIDPAARDWLDGIKQHSSSALLDALNQMALPADADRLERLTDRTMQARHLAGQARPDPVPSASPRPLEDKMHARHPDLVRWAGTLNEEHDDVLEPAVLERNLALVATALRSADIEFVVVSSPTEPGRVAVDITSAEAAVAAIRAHTSDVLAYTERIDAAGKRLFRTLAAATTYDDTDAAIVAYVPIVSPTRSLRYGPAHGCTVEFWRSTTDPAGFTGPLAPTRRGKQLTSLRADTTMTVGRTDVPTTTELVARRLDDVDFPIDAVWTWVDDTDPDWRSRRDSLTGSTTVAVNGDDPSRFNNRDELRYSMRSIAMYAPWIRHLYLVTDQQRPTWLADHPQVTVVDHREIFTDPDALPTFNSHAIESQLHHIPGLAESFLYFNDDVFLGRRVAPELFFTSTQQSKSFVSPTTIPPAPSRPDDLGFYASRKNDRQLIEHAFGRTMVNSYLHTPQALQVSVLDEMEQRFGEQWAHTQASRFRSPRDIAIAPSLHHAYAQMTGRGVSATLRSRYVKAGRAEHQALMRQILAQRNLDTFCLNDTADRDMDPQLQTSAMRAVLEAYFPMAAPWERR